MKFVLASKSPRRKELLSLFDIDLIITEHLFDENSIHSNINPEAYCKKISREKSFSIKDNFVKYPIISADTIVIVDNLILKKPTSVEEASEMLNLLSGRSHEVMTGVNILFEKNDIDFTFTEKTIVEFRLLNQKEILYYIKNFKPFDKSGSYGIQDFSSIFVKSINGCFFNVVGLPLSKLFYYLKKFKLIEFSLNT